MVSHRIASLGWPALLTVTLLLMAPAPATALAPPSASPSGSAPQATPAFVPCPLTPGAQAVVVPKTTLPPASPRDPDWRAIGGAGLATAGLTLPPGAGPLPTNLASRAWVIADLDTGDVLAACGPHERRPPASVQKLLLAATLMPRLDPSQVVEVTPADLDIEPGSSAVGLITGGRYSIETLWLSLLLVSGNDAANALARVGGGTDGVAGTMRAANALAHELGARDTHAVTPHGLDAPGQFTSAYDLALIARACLKRDDFRRYATTPSTKIPAQPPRDPRGFQIQNDNSLIANYPGALGGKTGFTDAARHTYVGAAERDGRRLVVTLLGGEVIPQRSWSQAAALLDWGFGLRKGAAVGRLVAPGEVDSGASTDQRAIVGGSSPNQGAGGSSSSTPLRQLTLVAAVMTVPVFAAAIVAASLRNQRRAARRRSRRRSVSSHKGTHP